MLKVFSHPYQLYESISNFRVVWWCFFFIFIPILKEHLFANTGEPVAASDLVLHLSKCSTKRTLRLYGLRYKCGIAM